jgi:hypothetical protein
LCRISHRKGYGIHSPFAFNLVTGVIYERGQYYAYEELGGGCDNGVTDFPVRDLRLLFRLSNAAEPRRGLVLGAEMMAVRAYLERGASGCVWAEAEEGWMDDGAEVDLVYVGEGVNLAQVLPGVLRRASERCVVVVRRIYRTAERLEAWETLRGDERVRVTFDLYEFGLAYFERRLNKEDYIICY